MSKEQKESLMDNQLDQNLLEAMNAFFDRFVPTSEVEEADEMMSTADIARELSEIIEYYDHMTATVIQLMKENGFTFRYVDGFVWLLKLAPTPSFE